MIFSSLLSASLASPVANPASEMTKEKYDKLPTKQVFKDVKLDVVAYCAGYYAMFGEDYGYAFQTIKGTDSEGKLKFDNDDLIIAGVGTVQRVLGPSVYRTRFNPNDQTLHSKASWEKLESSLESTSERYRYNIESSPNKKPVTLKECNKDNRKNKGKWGYVTKFTVYYDTMTFTKNDPNVSDPIE